MNPETQKKARLWLAIVFALGLAVGAVFGYSFGHRSYADSGKPATQLSEPERRAKRVEAMTKELNLTAEQSAKVDAIIHQTHDEMKVVRDRAEGDVDGLRQRARDEIRLFLTPEQKPKFEVMVQRMDAERKKTQGMMR
jgi:Spy/CpxP family protein refolding chaperone